MLDKPEKTPQFLNIIKSNHVFRGRIDAYLHAQLVAFAVKPRQIASLTHVPLAHSLPFAAAVFDCQKHRVKKAMKPNRT